MVTRRYGMSSTASDILKRHKENACITNYIRVKNEIVQKINELQKKEPRQFCSKCDTIKKLIIAENEKVNNCYLRNSKSFKLIEDDDIKDFIEECIDFRTCFHNRTSSAKKTAAPARTSAGKDKQQSGRDSKTSKPGGSPIKSLPGKDQNPTDVKELTKAKPIAHNPDGISASHNAGEAQKESSKQIPNLPASTSGRTETLTQKISQSVHSQVTETDSRPSTSIQGTSDGEDHLSKSNELIDLGKSKSQSDSTSGQIADSHGVKNQERGGSTPDTKISDTGDHAVQGVGTNACSKIVDGVEACDKKVVNRDSATVPSVDVSIDFDFNLDEYPCSKDYFDELYGSEILSGEAHDREASSIKAIDNEEPGTVLPRVKLNHTNHEDREPTVLYEGQKIIVPEEVSDINRCQTTSDTVLTPRCVPSNHAAESSFTLQTEIRTEEQKNNGQLSSRQDLHHVNKLNQQEPAKQEGLLNSEEKLSLQVEGHSGGKNYIIEDIVQHLHLQKNCSLRQSIYCPRRERSIYTNKLIYT
ncbi:hypothetical protein PVBG_05812 [Plasmodium vivax Brazil I]|uniref:VIR protein n=1 Tax=Plasmodium vivax (strain Brazil I) TaxID=1033975 RepID=A0A0J9SXT6_PLAV1|nr:hypothetical protein PVBG_05812 [Plasmodium vivax Brazil I]